MKQSSFFWNSEAFCYTIKKWFKDSSSLAGYKRYIRVSKICTL